jgi:hypothetical protein
MTVKRGSNVPAVINHEPKLPASRSGVPDFLRNDKPMRGLERTTKEDFTIPRLAVCQNMSPQRPKNGKPEAIENLEEGMFFNTVTHEIYGERDLLVTPLMFYRTRWYLDDDGNMLCFSPDGYTKGKLNPSCDECPHSQFKDGTGKESQPDCTLFFNVPILLHHVDDPERDPEVMVVSMKGANLKGAKNWNTLMRMRNHDVFGGLYVLTPIQKQHDLGTYYIIQARNAGLIKDQPLFQFAESQYEQLSKIDLAARQDLVDLETRQNDTGGM